MAVAIAPQFTQRIYKWTAWKVIRTSKSLIHQHDDDGVIYTIYGYDGPEVHVCQIYKGTVPYQVVNDGYSQAQNDSDKSDFETNWMSSSNTSVILPNKARVHDGSGNAITSSNSRLSVDALSSVVPIPGSSVVYMSAKLLNGSSDSMTVNGSSVNVNFDFTPASSETWYVENISVFLQDNGATLPTNFGSLSGALANGIDILIRSGGTEYTIANIKTNMDLDLVFKESPQIPGTSGLFESSDIYIGTIHFSVPIKVQNSTSDYVRMKVRDNLSGLDQLKARTKVWRAI